MVETPNHAAINIYPQLENGVEFQVNEINKIKHYLMVAICVR